MGLALAKFEIAPLILVVDDEDSIREALKSILEDEGYRTICAANGTEALKLTQEQNPAIVLLDIWMPGWDGVETLQRIKDVNPDTAVIMISGHATIANALEATKRGAFDFIEKPLDLETVISSTERALAHREQLAIESFDSNLLIASNKHAGPTSLHPGAFTKGLAGKNVGQRTIKNSIILYGQCLHSGQKSGLVLEPLPKDSGIWFAKLGNPQPVPSFVSFVDSTSFATTLSSGPSSVSTIEHLLSALHAYKISNLLIKCNDEVPIFDGSSKEICREIENVGIEEQGAEWLEVAVDKPYHLSPGNSGSNPRELISIKPHPSSFVVTYELDYPEPVGSQSYTFDLSSVESYKEAIAPARTFGFLRDIERLQRAGLAAGGRLDNFILIGPEGVLNTDLRYPDELARHKVLDVIGDLFLLGRPIRGEVHARLSGHSDNINLLRLLEKRACS